MAHTTKIARSRRRRRTTRTRRRRRTRDSNGADLVHPIHSKPLSHLHLHHSPFFIARSKLNQTVRFSFSSSQFQIHRFFSEFRYNQVRTLQLSVFVGFFNRNHKQNEPHGVSSLSGTVKLVSCLIQPIWGCVCNCLKL